MSMIHETAIVHDGAILESGVKVGAFSIIHSNVLIKSNTVIEAYCEIGYPSKLAQNKILTIGHNSLIRSHSVLYEGSTIGDNFVCGHYVSIRENSSIGINFQIGSRGDIQGDCKIGNFTKMHADVHIGKLSKIGNFVWLFPEVLITNDPTPPSEELVGSTIEDFVIVAAKVLIYPGLTIMKDSVISAGSVIKSNVTQNDLFSGAPAKKVCPATFLRHHTSPSIKAYPWRFRFQRGYPKEITDSWDKEKALIITKI